MESGFREPLSPVLAFVPNVPNTLLWIVAGIVAYWVGIVALRNRGLLPSYVGAQGPILTVHTKRGRAFLDWLASPRRVWRAWANLGVGIALVVMAAMFAFLLTAAIATFQTPQPTTAVQQPRNVLVIPGINDFLPLSAAPEIVFGLLVGLVVHEGGHGLLCRVEDIDIESMGVALLAAVPVGAFVEPEARSRDEASRGEQTRMFAAGVTNNFAVTIVAFALLFGPVAGAIAVAPGGAVGGVVPGSPAEAAGIEANDRITAVGDRQIDDNDDLETFLAESDDETVPVTLNGDRTETVERSLLVTATVENGPIDVRTGDRIVAVNDTSIATEREFDDAVGDAEVVTLSIERSVDGETRELDREVPIGAYTRIAEDGPLAAAGAPVGADFVVTDIDGERVQSYDGLSTVLDEREPGDEIAVEGYLEGERRTVTVTLDENPRTGGGFVGIVGAQGVSGLGLNDFGVQLYPAETFLGALGGDGDGDAGFGGLSDSFLGKIVFALFLPLIAIVGNLSFNFAGFTGGIQNFYEVQGTLAYLGDGTVFLLANLLFWTGWINVQLGFFNCIPAFPLDGGHILRTSTEAAISRLPIDATRGMVRTVTTGVGLAMLLSFLLMLFGPQLFAG